MSMADGGTILAQVLAEQGVTHLFALCGGHISPILVGAKRAGLFVIDVRDEASAVFAADAAARLTGRVGVAAVTAGPGVTNAVTALKNAQLAESAVVLFGGATATVLRGRGALQDIDQLSILRPVTKWATSIATCAALAPTVRRAFDVARTGVPGPVFVEVPIDLLYPEATVRQWYLKEAGGGKSFASRALSLALRGHLYRQFHAPHLSLDLPKIIRREAVPDVEALSAAADLLTRAERPVLVIGSQTMTGLREPAPLAEAVRRLRIPTWLGGAARGLLGPSADIQFVHGRADALRKADVVLLAGFPFDFRLKYGRGFGPRTKLVAVNLSSRQLRKNRRPDVAAKMHPAEFLERLSRAVPSSAEGWQSWMDMLRRQETEREAEIDRVGAESGELVHPVSLFRRINAKAAPDAVFVADGGDFVATAAYVLRPRGPLRWLDPGVFGTLGVGGGFALGAAALRRGSETWVFYGDGSCAYSLAEIDTCVRHGLGPIFVIGTDASWAQIARDQVDLLGDDVGTVLRRTDYHRVAEGYGGVGLLLDDPGRIDEVLDAAKAHAAAGRPVVINAHIRRTDFRKGSISV